MILDREQKNIKKNYTAHSQGTIKYTAAINDLYNTEEGKKLLREYKEKSLLLGLAITPKMYDDLGRKLDEISDSRDEKKLRINLEKIVNKSDMVPGMWGYNPNTDWKDHPVANYNLLHYDKTPEGIYRRRSDKKEKAPNLEFNLKKLINLDMKKRFNINRGDSK